MVKLRAMPQLALAACLVSGCVAQQDASSDWTAHLDRGRHIARSVMVADTHIDVPYRLEENFENVAQATESGDFDYPRAQAGGLDLAFMSIYIPARLEAEGGAVELADELIDMMEKLARDNPDKFAMATSVAEAERNFAAGRISLALGMENGAPIAGSFDKLRHFYDRGIRYVTLTHSKSNHISDSSYDDNRRWRGLSPFGKRLIGEMNRLGVIVDISHVSDEAFYQAVELSAVPVLATHSSARFFTPGWERNMDDAMIRKLAEHGGVIQINYGSTFISQRSRENYEAMAAERDRYLEENGLVGDAAASDAFTRQYRETTPFEYADISDVLDHFDHVRNLVGVDHIGIGSDYDGVGDSLPVGLKDVSTYPNLVAGLLARGYSEADIEKILSGNTLRVWRAVEAYAAGHQ